MPVKQPRRRGLNADNSFQPHRARRAHDFRGQAWSFFMADPGAGPAADRHRRPVREAAPAARRKSG